MANNIPKNNNDALEASNLFPKPNTHKTSNEQSIMLANPEANQLLSELSLDELQQLILKKQPSHNNGLHILTSAMEKTLDERWQKAKRDANKTNPNPDEITEEVIHKIPMLSHFTPDNPNFLDALRHWLPSYNKEIIAFPNFEGVYCSLIYDECGRLKQASTCGNGYIGKDITHFIKKIPAIPNKIRQDSVEIRGHLCLPKSHLRSADKANTLQWSAKHLVQELIQNTTKQTQIKIDLEQLNFFATDVIGIVTDTEDQKTVFLYSMGFNIPPYDVLERNDTIDGLYKNICNCCDTLIAYSKRKSVEWTLLDYDISGVVFKINDKFLHSYHEVFDHHPKNTIAHRFHEETANTSLTDVTWQVGLEGIITPILKFQSVRLYGAIIRNVCLKSYEELYSIPYQGDKDDVCECLKIGSNIHIIRENNSPATIEAIFSNQNSKTEIPRITVCPSCGAHVIQSENHIRCSQPEQCLVTGKTLLEKYLKATRCNAWIPEPLEQIFSSGLLYSPADLYKLQEEDILDSIFDTNIKTDTTIILAKKLYHAIQETKQLHFSTFLKALAIHAFTPKITKLLAQKFENIDNLLAADLTDLRNVFPKSKTAQIVYSQLQLRTPLIRELLKNITVYKDSETILTQESRNPFMNRNFIISGQINSPHSYYDAEARITRLGGNVQDKVTKKLNIAIVIDKETTKWEKISQLIEQGLSISIWSKQDFHDALRRAEMYF